MRFMNTYDISDAVEQLRAHPVLGPASRTLQNLEEWADTHSDGWHSWPKPARAARSLMALIEGDMPGDDRCPACSGNVAHNPRCRRPDATPAAYRKALAPVKAFRTRQGADFQIEEL